MTRSIEIRRQLLRAVERFPGLHLRELARHAETSEALASYHLQALAEGGHIESRVEGQNLRFFPKNVASPPEADRELLGLLRRPIPLQIAVLLIEQGTARNQDLAKRLHLAKSTVSYHVTNLVATGLLEHDDATGETRLRDPKRVERLLLRWTPPQDMTDRFGSLWRRFYGARKAKP